MEPLHSVASLARSPALPGEGLLPDCNEDRSALRRPAFSGQIIAVMPTYSRKEQLCQCVDACLSQTEPPDYLFLFDNGSTDATKDYLAANGYLANPRIRYFSVSENIGCAAAFDRLFRLFWQSGGDWMWVLEDDVIPSATALAELKAAYVANFSRPEDVGLLASKIVDIDGKPNNVPEVDRRSAPGHEPNWGEFLGQGLVKIRWSVFCSYLMPRSTLARFGSVNPDFYSAGVDIEFTLRITDSVPAYVVGRSQVTHLRKVHGHYTILTESDPYRMWAFFRYHHRNNMYIRRKYYSPFNAFLYFGRRGIEMLQALAIKEHRWFRIWSILNGIVSGIFFNPKSDSLAMTDPKDGSEALRRPLSSYRGDPTVSSNAARGNTG